MLLLMFLLLSQSYYCCLSKTILDFSGALAFTTSCTALFCQLYCQFHDTLACYVQIFDLLLLSILLQLFTVLHASVAAAAIV